MPTTYAQTYDYYHIGDTTDVTGSTSFGVCLMGGATENDNGSTWFLNKSGGGNIVVLRTSGGDGYHDYFFNQLGLNLQSVETFVFNNISASSDPFVLRRIEQAEAIWIAGGDQFTYETIWKNTGIETLLNDHINLKKAPVGGTSAGMAILGEYYFNAQNGTITSQEALSNPYDTKLIIESNFLQIPILENTITDTHYDNPDRKGRHIAFMARIQEQDISQNYYGIGADEYVAVCIEENGIATIYGDHPSYEDNAYFLRTNCSNDTPSVLSANTPLTWNPTDPAILSCNMKGTTSGDNKFDLVNWTNITGGIWEDWSIENGTLSTSPVAFEGCSTSSLNNGSESDLYVFPNPANDFIKLSTAEHIKSIDLYNSDGRLVKTATSTNIFDITSVSNGIYTLKVVNGQNYLKNFTVIIQH